MISKIGDIRVKNIEKSSVSKLLYSEPLYSEVVTSEKISSKYTELLAVERLYIVPPKWSGTGDGRASMQAKPGSGDQ